MRGLQGFKAQVQPLEGDARRPAIAAELLEALVGKVRARDQDLFHPLLGVDGGQGAVAAEDAVAVQDLAFLQGVVVGETDQEVAAGAVIEQLAQQEFAPVAR